MILKILSGVRPLDILSKVIKFYFGAPKMVVDETVYYDAALCSAVKLWTEVTPLRHSAKALVPDYFTLKLWTC